jgi:hypothetical protein
MTELPEGEIKSFKIMVLAVVEMLVSGLEQRGLDSGAAYTVFVGEILPVAAGLHLLHHGSEESFLQMARTSLALARQDIAKLEGRLQ